MISSGELVCSVLLFISQPFSDWLFLRPALPIHLACDSASPWRQWEVSHMKGTWTTSRLYTYKVSVLRVVDQCGWDPAETLLQWSHTFVLRGWHRRRNGSSFRTLTWSFLTSVVTNKSKIALDHSICLFVVFELLKNKCRIVQDPIDCTTVKQLLVKSYLPLVWHCFRKHNGEIKVRYEERNTL